MADVAKENNWCKIKSSIATRGELNFPENRCRKNWISFIPSNFDFGVVVVVVFGRIIGGFSPEEPQREWPRRRSVKKRKENKSSWIGNFPVYRNRNTPRPQTKAKPIGCATNLRKRNSRSAVDSSVFFQTKISLFLIKND